MTATLAAPRETGTVESYWQLAERWRDAGRQHSWISCPCLCCADMRAHRRMSPLPIEIGDHVFLPPRANGAKP